MSYKKYTSLISISSTISWNIRINIKKYTSLISISSIISWNISINIKKYTRLISISSTIRWNISINIKKYTSLISISSTISWNISINKIKHNKSKQLQNKLLIRPVCDYKPAWKQVLFTWSFITKQPDIWWTCVGISFRILFTWYFIIRNEISLLSKWPIWNPFPHWVSKAHAR